MTKNLIRGREDAISHDDLKVVRPVALISSAVCGLPDGPYGDILHPLNETREHYFARWLSHDVLHDITKWENSKIRLSVWLHPENRRPAKLPTARPTLCRTIIELSYQMACGVDIEDKDLEVLMPYVDSWAGAYRG
jgi:hypothetical protein